MVLTVAISELSLDEQLFARNAGGGDARADRGLEVMPPLIGGVNAAEAGLDGEAGQPLGLVFLPGGAVEKGGEHLEFLGVAGSSMMTDG